MLNNKAERRTIMTTVVNLKDGGKIEVRIKDGQIETISYENHGHGTTYERRQKQDIQFQLKNIFDEDIEKLKEVLVNIRGDEEFFAYGKQFMDAKRERLLANLSSYKKEVQNRIQQMEKEVNKFTLPK